MKDCTTCKYGYEDEQLGIPMCHHPKRFSEDCVDFNMHEEKPIPKDLEEAANEHVNNIAYCGDDIELEKEQSRRDFIAGAKWQKQHDAELIEIAYNDGITIGMTKQKEQMMKEAVEGEED